MSEGSPPPMTAEQWAALPIEFRVWSDALQAQNAELRRVVAELKGRVAELEFELRAVRKTSQNSSLPPSTEHPHAKTSGKGESGDGASGDGAAAQKNKRKRGGQQGHPKHERPLVPVERCDEVVSCRPTECRGCGTKLRKADDDLEPLRHQVWEVPQPDPVITEYQLHRVTCPCCGIRTCGELPDGVPQHTSGPRLMAVTAILMGLFRQSKSRTSLALLTLFGVPCCPATVVNIQKRVTDALASCYEEVRAAVPSASQVHCDETPFKEGTSRSWLWTFVTTTFTLFALRLTRSAAVPDSILGKDYAGVVITDRYSGYSTFNDRRQFCWAHLKRDFQARIDAGGDGALIGNRLMELLRDMFKLWHLYRAGRLCHDTLRQQIEETIQWKFYNTLEDGQRCRHAPTQTLCNSLFNRFDQLWTFSTTPGVEPTNNRAEQSLRHAVIWRKLSFGTQSEKGSRFVETLLTVVETCRQQKRNTLDFLAASIQAHLNSKPAPKLITGV